MALVLKTSVLCAENVLTFPEMSTILSIAEAKNLLLLGLNSTYKLEVSYPLQLLEIEVIGYTTKS